MVGRGKQRAARIGWRRIGIVVGCVGLVGGTIWWFRGGSPPQVQAEPLSQPTATVPAPAPLPSRSDYANRVVAYLNGTETISREELGEYLIARYGPEKLDLLINKRILDEECRKNNVEVTAADLEEALVTDLKGLNINRSTFVSTVLGRYKKSLYEWKEDVLRPKLQLTRLSRNRIHVKDQDVVEAFEAAYGEKLTGRIIIYPVEQGQLALTDHPRLRDSEQAFQDKALHQDLKSLADNGGKIKPFGRHTMGDADFDDKVFRLQPGQVSDVIQTPQGWVVFKCDQHLPADTTHGLQAEREKLVKDIVEKKLQSEMHLMFIEMRKRTNPQKLLKRDARTDEVVMAGAPAVPLSTQVVAYYNKNIPITREDLGEYLIARYGAEKLDLMLNKRIIDQACRERHIEVTPEEINTELKADLLKLKLDLTQFRKEFLTKNKKSLFEWREDVLKPRVQMSKLCRDRIRWTEEDLRAAFDAHHGEKMQCRIIIWPQDQGRFAMQVYPRIRDSEAEFVAVAKSQASAQLAAKGGRIEAFGRHTMGDENLEREAFKLQPGEVSTLIGTAQGIVCLKCDGRIPPERNVSLDAERPRLIKEILEKKVQMEMLVVMKELRDRVNPRPMLVDPNRPVDLTAETRREIADEPIQPSNPLPPGPH